MKIEHQIWRPTIAGGIEDQQIAVIGYSHYYAEGEADHDDMTQVVMRRVIEGSEKHAFFTAIREYFGYDSDKEFWNRVYFFNFLAESIGPTSEKYCSGTEAQREDGKKRFLGFLEEEKPDKVFIFSRKGWRSFPETTIEELDGKPCNRLIDDLDGPTWGTYMVGDHRVLVCGFRHPQYAKSEDLKIQVQKFLVLR